MNDDFVFKSQQKLSLKVGEIASILVEEGKRFNDHLLQQFEQGKHISLEGMESFLQIPEEHIVFYKVIAQTLGWIQQLPVEKDTKSRLLESRYLQVLLEKRNEKNSNASKDVSTRLGELLEKSLTEEGLKTPRRLLAVVAGLETWAKVTLPMPIDNDKGNLDPEEIQNIALKESGRARWTALAPNKLYALYRGFGTTTPRSIYPPMGTAVSRGIERLYGFSLGESENDYKLSRGLHIKLADLAHASIWEINSGFYRLGGGK